MAKNKQLTITVDKQKYVATRAELLVSDASDYGYNHPVIVVTLERPDKIRSGNSWDRVTTRIVFQRGNSRDIPEATDVMDTALPWSHCYAGRVELDSRGFELADRPFALDHTDEVRIALGRRIARERRERNLSHVHADEALQVSAALDALGVHVERSYCLSRGGTVPLWQCPGRGASERRRAELAAAGVKVAS